MMRVLVVAGLAGLAVVAGAQEPAPRPAAEGAPVWTAHEALAAVLAQRMAAGWSERGELMPASLEELGIAHAYGMLSAMPDAAGQWQFDGDGNAARTAAPGQLLCYLVPRGDGPSRRLFCVRGDGVVAFTENTAGTRGDGAAGRDVGAADVLGEGGRGSWRDFPRTPGRGRDGNLWLPGEQLPKATLRLRVCDERGEPLGAACVATVAAEDDEAVDAALPAGRCRTRLEGDAVLQGPPARGLRFVFEDGGVVVPLPAAAIHLDGGTARVTVAAVVRLRARLPHNESAAIATLKNISSAQAQCQASGVIDVNGNGAGEYGTFAELTGRDVVRGGRAAMAPPVLSTSFSIIENGVVTRGGYCFRVVLPGKDGAAVAELANGGPDAAAIDAAQAETLWCVYAWPLEAGVTGGRAFVIDQSGDVRGCRNDDARYSGPGKPPPADASRDAASRGRMQDGAAVNAVGRDGQTWVVIG